MLCGTGLAYAAVLQLHGGPWLDCYEYPNLFPGDREAYSGNKNNKNAGNADGADRGRRGRRGSDGESRSEAVEHGDDGDAAISTTAAESITCEWKPDYSICDVCRSALCHSCKVCEHSATADCAPCREGIMPCIPLCIDHTCW